jgi:hypothetical protein
MPAPSIVRAAIVRSTAEHVTTETLLAQALCDLPGCHSIRPQGLRRKMEVMANKVLA